MNASKSQDTTVVKGGETNEISTTNSNPNNACEIKPHTLFKLDAPNGIIDAQAYICICQSWRLCQAKQI